MGYHLARPFSGSDDYPLPREAIQQCLEDSDKRSWSKTLQLSSARIFHPVSATATLCLVDPLSVPHPIPEASYQRLVRKHFLSRCTPLTKLEKVPVCQCSR